MRHRIALERFVSVQPNQQNNLAAGPDSLPPPAGEIDADLSRIDPEVARQTCLERISANLEIVASEQAGLRARCIADVAAAFGAAAEALLPRLAQAGFAALVAETAQSIAQRGRWPDLRLNIAPENATAIADALKKIEPSTKIEIVENTAHGADEARIDWDQGGAEIDIDAIVTSALDQYRRKLDGRLQQGDR